ncbi:MAG: hypothetical protein GEU78_16115 [Actinobacteria bacterium]|nr:hypothetical protein [Actinomycetota bacterium]
MKILKAFKVLAFSAALMVLMAVPAFAQTTPAEDVQADVIAEATPYFTILVAIVVALFGLTLLVALAKKAAAMAKGGLRRG